MGPSGVRVISETPVWIQTALVTMTVLLQVEN